MSKYIRRPAVFNGHSERELRIWNWIKEETGDFKNQNFAAFVRDKLEWCMNHKCEMHPVVTEPKSTLKPNEEKIEKKGWSSLI